VKNQTLDPLKSKGRHGNRAIPKKTNKTTQTEESEKDGRYTREKEGRVKKALWEIWEDTTDQHEELVGKGGGYIRQEKQISTLKVEKGLGPKIKRKLGGPQISKMRRTKRIL